MEEEVDLSKYLPQTPTTEDEIDLSAYMPKSKQDRNFPGTVTPKGFIPVEDYTKDTPESFGKRIASHADPKAWQPSKYGFKTLQATIGDTPRTIREDGAMWDPDLQVWSFQDPNGGPSKRAPDALSQPPTQKPQGEGLGTKAWGMAKKVYRLGNPLPAYMYDKISGFDPSGIVDSAKRSAEANQPWTLNGITRQQYEALPFLEQAKLSAKGQAVQLKNTFQTAQMTVPYTARQIVKAGAGFAAMTQDAGTQLGQLMAGDEPSLAHSDVVAQNKHDLAALGLPESIADLPQYASEKIANLWQDPAKVEEFLTPGRDTIGGKTGQAFRLAAQMLAPTKAMEVGGVAPQLAENLMSGSLGALGGGEAYNQTALQGDMPINESRAYSAGNAVIQGLAPKVGLSKMGEGYSGMVADAITQNPFARNAIAKTGAAGLDAAFFTAANNANTKFINPEQSVWDMSTVPETFANFLLLKSAAGPGGVKYDPKNARDIMANIDLSKPLLPVAQRAAQGEHLSPLGRTSQEGFSALEREMMGTKSASQGDQAVANMIVKEGVPGATPEDHALVNQTRAEMAANVHAESIGQPAPFPDAMAKVQTFTPLQQRISDISTNLNRSLKTGLDELAILKGDPPAEDNPWMDSRVVLDHPDTLGGIIKRGGSKTTANVEKERTVNAFIDEDGSRSIGVKQDNGAISITRPDGSHGVLNQEGGKLVDTDGKTYTQTHATTTEAEAITNHTYSKNSIANNAKAMVDLNNAIRNVHVQQAVKDQAGEAAQQRLATGVGEVGTLGEQAKSKFPQIGDTELPIEWVKMLDAKAASDIRQPGDTFLEKAKAGFMKGMFQISPFYHSVKNVSLHNIQSAGVDLPSYLTNLPRASQMLSDYKNGVVTPEMKAYLDAGAPLLGDYSKNNDFKATFEKESGRADLNLPESGPIDPGFKQTDLSNRVTWTPDDVGRASLVITKTEAMTKKPFNEATPSQIASAVYEVSRHNPDYQVSRFDRNQWFANGVVPKAVGIFQKYAAQMTKGMTNAVGDLGPQGKQETPELAKMRRKDTAAGLATSSIGAAIMMGLGGAAIRGITQNPNLTMKPGAGVGATYRVGKAIYDEGPLGAIPEFANEFFKLGPVINIFNYLKGDMNVKYGAKGYTNSADWHYAREEAKKGNLYPIGQLIPHEVEQLAKTLAAKGAFSLGPLMKDENPRYPVGIAEKVLKMFGMAQSDLPEETIQRMNKAPKYIQPKSIMQEMTSQPEAEGEDIDLSKYMVKQ